MAVKFLEPGGDADFSVASGNGFWNSFSGAAVATDFVHGNHQKSIKFRPGFSDQVSTANGIFADAGSRLSFYLYINAQANATFSWCLIRNSGSSTVVRFRITTGGVLQLWNDTVQIGTDGATLSTGQWYRISLAYTISSKTVNRFVAFVNGVSSISVTNATLGFTGSANLIMGNPSGNATWDIRTSDHYVDNSSSLADTGNIWVTAKRPNANGTTNGFTTQIGSGGSGYGTGHSPQVNERPLSVTNGWSMVGAGSAITEEYNIESKSIGDIDISTATIIDYLGWVSASAALSETGSIIVNNVSSNISLTSTNTLFTKIAGSSSYPAGTGTDIGLITATTVTTVSLYECGVIVAYIPGGGSSNNLSLLGVT